MYMLDVCGSTWGSELGICYAALLHMMHGCSAHWRDETARNDSS